MKELKGYGVAAGVVFALLLFFGLLKGAGKFFEKAKEVITVDLNPASNENVIYKGVTGAVDEAFGEGVSASIGDRVFGAWFAFNPFISDDDSRKKYGKKVWGIGDDS